MNYNQYIDFKKMFCDLIEFHKEELIEALDDNHGDLGKIARFVKVENLTEWEILNDECLISDERIDFVLGIDFNDANEGNTQSATADVHIIYNRSKEEFTYYDYKQG